MEECAKTVPFDEHVTILPTNVCGEAPLRWYSSDSPQEHHEKAPTFGGGFLRFKKGRCARPPSGI